jgi:alpha-beta hydrolase superfamily lysophospholipase
MMSPIPLKPRPAGSRRRSIAEIQAARAREGGPVTHGYFNSFDGTKLFYSVEGSGPPLVFCYGLVCSSLHWTYQIDYFQSRYRAIWFDYRGHHNSEVPKDLGSLTLPNMARDLGILLDELKIEDAVFLGHSMGVNTVLELYRQQPRLPAENRHQLPLPILPNRW